ncbi:hypothetical protein LBMAG52_21120 [Planctomycetia bacterium]|nr:hypothetical protein LBMAG52_21120 [Planctomycetia bacterium]
MVSPPSTNPAASLSKTTKRPSSLIMELLELSGLTVPKWDTLTSWMALVSRSIM